MKRYALLCAPLVLVLLIGGCSTKAPALRQSAAPTPPAPRQRLSALPNYSGEQMKVRGYILERNWDEDLNLYTYTFLDESRKHPFIFFSDQKIPQDQDVLYRIVVKDNLLIDIVPIKVHRARHLKKRTLNRRARWIKTPKPEVIETY